MYKSLVAGLASLVIGFSPLARDVNAGEGDPIINSREHFMISNSILVDARKLGLSGDFNSPAVGIPVYKDTLKMVFCKETDGVYVIFRGNMGGGYASSGLSDDEITKYQTRIKEGINREIAKRDGFTRNKLSELKGYMDKGFDFFHSAALVKKKIDPRFVDNCLEKGMNYFDIVDAYDQQKKGGVPLTVETAQAQTTPKYDMDKEDEEMLASIKRARGIETKPAEKKPEVKTQPTAPVTQPTAPFQPVTPLVVQSSPEIKYKAEEVVEKKPDYTRKTEPDNKNRLLNTSPEMDRSMQKFLDDQTKVMEQMQAKLDTRWDKQAQDISDKVNMSLPIAQDLSNVVVAPKKEEKKSDCVPEDIFNSYKSKHPSPSAEDLEKICFIYKKCLDAKLTKQEFILKVFEMSKYGAEEMIEFEK